jgi:hypothetical protein
MRVPLNFQPSSSDKEESQRQMNALGVLYESMDANFSLIVFSIGFFH